MNNEIEDQLYKKAPRWIWSLCGGLSLLSFSLAISCRMMDFNPGPLWEKQIELNIEQKALNNHSMCLELMDRVIALELLAHPQQ